MAVGVGQRAAPTIWQIPDDLWLIVQHVLPREELQRSRGRPWIPPRRILDAVLYDECGGELYEREVVLGLLLPADEQFAVTVEPGVRAFNDPASRALPAPTASALLTAATNVRHEAAAPHRLVRVGVVVALVQTEVLLGEGGRPNDPGVEQLSQRGLVGGIGGCDHQRDRHAAAVG